MALFTSKADASLPLLTQLYQLEHDEIPAWLNLYSGSGVDLSEADWGRFSELLGVVCMVMEALADEKPPVPGALNELNFWIGEYASSENPRLKATVIWENGLSVVREQATPIALISQVLTELLDLIATARSDKSRKVSSCSICGNLFVVTRKGASRCSQRCRMRVGSRKRYAKIFEGYPTRRKTITGK
ncbi:hypothetical protein [Armatimonas sp.]|uniref:hypothetical protein n=1 Tax=Armatimonas sp. TaxID=1872638 RepID=UPI00286B6A35|nr:hypothetical protein [Armatimonas sp.]